MTFVWAMILLTAAKNKVKPVNVPVTGKLQSRSHQRCSAGELYMDTWWAAACGRVSLQNNMRSLCCTVWKVIPMWKPIYFCGHYYPQSSVISCDVGFAQGLGSFKKWLFMICIICGICSECDGRGETCLLVYKYITWYCGFFVSSTVL